LREQVTQPGGAQPEQGVVVERAEHVGHPGIEQGARVVGHGAGERGEEGADLGGEG
jgi:hypothetical protein